MMDLAHPVQRALAFLAFAAASLATCCTASSQVAVKAGTLYTMAGEPVKNAVIVITDGKIAAIGPAASTAIPAGYETLEAAVVTPGLIDARCTVGVSGIANQRQDQDQLETSAPMQPELRAIDAYNPLDPLVAYLRSYGITTVNTGHAPGELISGQTAIFKTSGDTVEEAVVVSEAMVAATIGPGANRPGGAPGTRAKTIAMLRDQLLKAQEYQRKLAEPADAASASNTTDTTTDDTKKKTPPARDLRLETLSRVLKRELPLLVTANRSQDIQSLLRIAKEFDIRVILDSGAESYLLLDELKQANIDVLVHPTMARGYGEMENKSFETAGKLQAAGIRVAIQGGFEDYVPKARVVLFEAGVAAGQGNMGQDTQGNPNALRAITIDAAKILNIDTRVGSVELGKDGDLALYTGDPLEYTTQCIGVIIEGKVVSREKR
ncbi:MAG TPA: amidohydrolase family protein [Phycisphaerales bacterium]|nr:amidohydrolase family protein [Phycisphaerales bacterium]